MLTSEKGRDLVFHVASNFQAPIELDAAVMQMQAHVSSAEQELN